MSDSKMYNILNTLKGLEPTPEQNIKDTAQRIYESVEAQGSVMQGVNSVEARLNEKYMGFKQDVAEGRVDDVSKSVKSIYYPDKAQSPIKKSRFAYDAQGETNFKKYPDQTSRPAGMNPDPASRAAMDEADEEEGVAEDRETLQTKKGTIYKGGTYGTEYDPSDEEKKTKTKHVPKKGQKGRPKGDKPTDTKSAPKGDIFGRTKGDVPDGKPGKKIKGKGTSDKSRNAKADAEFDRDDKMDEAAKYRDPKYKDKLYTQEPPDYNDTREYDNAMYNPKPDNYPGAKRLKGGGEFDHNDPLQKGFGRYGHDVLDRGPRKGMPSRNHITSLKGSIKDVHGKHPAPVLPESRNAVHNMVLESVNFKRMMDEANMTLDEMLECMNQDIKSYKDTGDMTDRLRDFMHLHSHAKKQMEEAGPVPYEVPAVQRRAAGAPELTPQAVQQQDAERSMHPGMTKLDAPAPAESMNQELDELAKLAGITNEGSGQFYVYHKVKGDRAGGASYDLLKTFPDKDSAMAFAQTYNNKISADKKNFHSAVVRTKSVQQVADEGNAFTGKLANTPKGGEFELDGKKFTDTSSTLEEAMCNECGMYESMCKCNEGNLFTKHLKDTPKGGEFEIDGKKYKDTSSLDEGTCAKCDCDPCECGPGTTLEDIAKLAGIAQEGRDYGDTKIATPPKYDNTPDEEVMSVDVLTKGGDGEVAGKEKRMHSDKPTFKNADNPLAEAEFNPVEAMGRRLMRAYEAIKVAK